MGVMDEAKYAGTIDVPANAKPTTAEEIAKLCGGEFGGTSEVKIKTGLSIVRLHAGIYENGQPTNTIINVQQPWEVRVSFGLEGDLKDMLCGKWCVNVNFESYGPGDEFRLRHPEFYFDCHQSHWCVTIPGKGVYPTDCTTPYKVIVTVAAKSKCDKPLAIVGFVSLPEVLFLDAK